MSNSQANPQSPLQRFDFSSINAKPARLRVVEHAFLGHLNLRGSTQDSAFLSAVEKVLGIALPLQFNTFVQNDELAVLWYGPNEWLLVTQAGAESSLLDELRGATEDYFCAVTDVTGGSTVLEVSGVKAADLLQKGCPLDLHPSVFGSGQCAQSVLAKASFTVYKLADQGPLRLIIRRSFADYIGAWITDAAREFSS